VSLQSHDLIKLATSGVTYRAQRNNALDLSAFQTAHVSCTDARLQFLRAKFGGRIKPSWQ
jgi:hypothetical protein